MATLSIKNFPDDLYRQLKARAKQEGRSVAREVTVLLQEQLLRRKKYTIDDWRGLGADLWRGVDVEKYLDRERNSW
ncbi:MAG: FitA-like ribbon-helix-helix domain-containing protein [Thermoanaerobaculia bacterium]